MMRSKFLIPKKNFNFQKLKTSFFTSDSKPEAFPGTLWLNDVCREDLVYISETIGQHTYLGETDVIPTFPVHGVIYDNRTGRRFVNLTVSWSKKKIIVPFIIDSGSPFNVLGRETMSVLGLQSNKVEIPATYHVNLHGFERMPITYQPLNAKIQDVNIIGWEFMKETGVCEHLDIKARTVSLFRSYTDMFNHFN